MLHQKPMIVHDKAGVIGTGGIAAYFARQESFKITPGHFWSVTMPKRSLESRLSRFALPSNQMNWRHPDAKDDHGSVKKTACFCVLGTPQRSSRYFWQVGSRFQDHELTGLHPDVCNLERIGIRIDNPTLLEPNDANY
jgi:hypothetical protein